MPAYAVFEVIVPPDPSPETAGRYAQYKAAVPALIERHGGRYLARAAQAESLEGTPTSGRWHLVEFPSAAAARSFWESAEYLDLQPLRAGAADVRAVLVDPATSVGAPSADDAALLAAATAAKAHAHAPYSHFPVGAAILTDTGRVYVGCNVENAAFPQGVCAEAGAISAMAAGGDRVIDTIVTTCDTDDLPTPCGGCRQKILEFATPTTRIRVAGTSGFLKTYSIAELLPDAFGPSQLPEFG